MNDIMEVMDDISAGTLRRYERKAEAFVEGTRYHHGSRNAEA